jgi:hypothetical protein
MKVGKQQRRQHCDLVDAVVLVRRQVHAPAHPIGSLNRLTRRLRVRTG